MTKSRTWWIPGACVLTVAAAVAGTKIVESKQGERPQEGPPSKILVLVVSPDPVVRSDYEDVIAGELSLRGVTAIASHVTFPELPKERGPFEEKLIAEGFDALTLSRLVGMSDKLEWREGELTYSPEYLGMGFWGGYWFTYEQVFVPGYLQKETKVRVRTDFWRTSGKEGRLVWSGTSETLAPVNAPRLARQVGAAVAKALTKAKLI